MQSMSIWFAEAQENAPPVSVRIAQSHGVASWDSLSAPLFPTPPRTIDRAPLLQPKHMHYQRAIILLELGAK